MALNVKAVREAVGMSQAELSRRSGISRQTIIAMENDESYNVTAKTLLALADALGVTAQALFSPTVTSKFHDAPKAGN